MSARAPLTRLCALVFLAACSSHTPAPEDTDVAVAEPATANWMSDVFAGDDGVAIGKLLLPGAFNSSSYACAAPNGISPHAPELVASLWGSQDTGTDDLTRQRVVAWAKAQDRPIGEQLTDGIRSIEINITL